MHDTVLDNKVSAKQSKEKIMYETTNEDYYGSWYDNENNEPDEHDLKPEKELDFS